MFIGHFGVALAMKRAAPQTSLGVLTLAAQWVDLLWPVFLLLGLERVRIDPGNTAVTPLAFDSYPYTHSLVMGFIWGGALAFVYVIGSRDRARGRAAVWIAAAVISHWVLDWITHRPDLPITIGGAEKVGLGLWNSVPGTIAVEGTIFAAGALIYMTATRPRDRSGRVNAWIYLLVLAAIYAANLSGPPPPSPRAIALAGLGLWLFPLWTAWIDRHRFSPLDGAGGGAASV
jgi:hypothetical protein